MKKAGYPVVHTALLPDGAEQIAAELARIADEDVADLILTTGGTGFSRDWTPEATRDVRAERDVPGIPEAMRALSSRSPPRHAPRAAAGIRKGALIINLPGSPKAVTECLGTSSPALHGLSILKGTTGNCAR